MEERTKEETRGEKKGETREGEKVGRDGGLRKDEWREEKRK